MKDYKFSLVILVLILSIFGVFMVRSARPDFTNNQIMGVILGLAAMENWMRELGLAMNITQLGATADMIDAIADSTLIMQGGYRVLTRDEVVKILKEK